MEQAGKKSVVVFVSGKPVSEPWIQEHAGAVLQQFYPGELVRHLFLLIFCGLSILFKWARVARLSRRSSLVRSTHPESSLFPSLGPLAQHLRSTTT